MKKEEDQRETGQHMDMNKEKEYPSEGCYMCHKKAEDPNRNGSVTRNKVIGVTAAPADKSPDEYPWELTLETEA